MVKLVTLAKRQPGLSREDFLDRWRKDHMALVRQLPGMRRFSNTVALSGARDPYFDLVLEVWFDDYDQFAAANTSGSGHSVEASLARLCDSDKTKSVLVSERVIFPLQLTDTYLKSFVTVYQRPDLTLEEFDTHWREEHPKVVRQLPGILGYIQCPAVRTPGYEPVMDGVAQVWFPDIVTAQSTRRSPAWPIVRADEREFLIQEAMLPMVGIPDPEG